MSEGAVSKKYRDVAPETVERVRREEHARHKNPREAEKAVKRALHQLTGAFMSENDLKRARALILGCAAGDSSAVDKILMLHASTRERMDAADEIYSRIFAITGRPGSVLDVACGLNPIYLGSRGVDGVLGIDIHGGMVDVINECARALGWGVHAECADIMAGKDFGRYQLALLFKILPVLERQGKNAGIDALTRLSFDFAAVSFPLKTLGGREVGMELNYSRWFEGALAGRLQILERFALSGELIYVVRGGERTDA